MEGDGESGKKMLERKRARKQTKKVEGKRNAVRPGQPGPRPRAKAESAGEGEEGGGEDRAALPPLPGSPLGRSRPQHRPGQTSPREARGSGRVTEPTRLQART